MGSLKRNLKRKKNLRETKVAKKSLKQALNATMGIPTNCTGCSSSFDPATDADSWMVYVKGTSVTLLCPICYPNAKSH
jgi:hypothetical protein